MEAGRLVLVQIRQVHQELRAAQEQHQLSPEALLAGEAEDHTKQIPDQQQEEREEREVPQGGVEEVREELVLNKQAS